MRKSRETQRRLETPIYRKSSEFSSVERSFFVLHPLQVNNIAVKVTIFLVFPNAKVAKCSKIILDASHCLYSAIFCFGWKNIKCFENQAEVLHDLKAGKNDKLKKKGNSNKTRRLASPEKQFQIFFFGFLKTCGVC